MHRYRVWSILVCPLLALVALTGSSWPNESVAFAAHAHPTAGHSTVAAARPLVTLPEEDESTRLSSPDGRWIAAVDRDAGSLVLEPTADGEQVTVFPPGSTVGIVTWSPDSRYLLAVRTNWTWKEPRGSGVDVAGPIEIWSVEIGSAGIGEAVRLFQSDTVSTTGVHDDNAEQVVFGSWSPDSRSLLFWLGPLGVSILADGLAPYVLEVQTGQAVKVADVALLNPRYHSWSPDGATLALTAGGYRSAQVNKWLVLCDTTTAQATTVVSSSEQIPGIVAWSPTGDVIAYAAVSAVQSGDEMADLMTWDNPAIAGRRIYLLDPATGKHGRLNDNDSFQDAPIWSQDGQTLYYVERQGDSLVVMAADPTTGLTAPVEGAQEPLPEYVGYYGQSNLDELLALRPAGPLPAVTAVPSPTLIPGQVPDSEVLRLIFETHAAEIGNLAQHLLQMVADGQYTDYARQDVDVNDDGQIEMLVSGRWESAFLFVAIVAADAAGQLHEMFYTQNTDGKYGADVRARVESGPIGEEPDRLRVVADFLTLTGGTGILSVTWEQRWVVCQPNDEVCQLVWSAPLLRSDRFVTTEVARITMVATAEQPDGETIRVTQRRFGISLPLDHGDEETASTPARRTTGPATLETYHWDNTGYRLESRVQLAPGLEITREFDAQTQETDSVAFDLAAQEFSGDDGSFDGDVYYQLRAELWGLPAPGQPDDPIWGSPWRELEAAAYRGTDADSALWLAGVVGALDRPLCRLSVHRQAAGWLTRVGRVDVPCTPAFTHLTWADLTGDGLDDLLLLTIAPEADALGQLQRLYLFTTAEGRLTQLATLDGTINGDDGIGIRLDDTGGRMRVLTGLPLADPDATPLSLDDLHLDRTFKAYVWDAIDRTFLAAE